MRIVACVALCACIAGCGASKPSAHVDSREKLADACGNVRARLEGIAHEVGLRDPQPALFRGNLIAERLRTATKQALSTTGEQARELESLGAPRTALLALSAAAKSYELFAHGLTGHRRRTPSANLKLGAQFEVIGLRAAVACEEAVHAA